MSGVSSDKREDRVSERLDMSGSAVSTLRSGAHLAFERPPRADARGTNLEPFARLPMAQALLHRHQHPNQKIKQ
jgi:hypothetical protein